jgi:hypothetical protein
MGAAIIQTQRESFQKVLAAAGRSPEIPESSDVYGWLVGDWDLQVLHYRGIDVANLGLTGEVHAAWVLEGRAIQDVWIMPRRSERTPDTAKTNNMYGTTLRIWEPSLQAWLIRWINPVSGHLEQQTGRRIGDEIVQIGARADGTPIRWRFTEITTDSFHWIGEALNTDGRTWRLEGEFLARRVDD